MSKRRKKKCLACKRRYGRRSQRNTQSYCSNLCRDSAHIEAALLGNELDNALPHLNTLLRGGMMTPYDARSMLQSAGLLETK